MFKSLTSIVSNIFQGDGLSKLKGVIIEGFFYEPENASTPLVAMRYNANRNSQTSLYDISITRRRFGERKTRQRLSSGHSLEDACREIRRLELQAMQSINKDNSPSVVIRYPRNPETYYMSIARKMGLNLANQWRPTFSATRMPKVLDTRRKLSLTG